ncbi:efflux RND transporter periplasmic adaptor subunit [Tumidithrix elongata RA019]|uniref:Efflux RND transporter periplasmic adaptor subunit n=1 Tax=Tumidithrix elongata BACA0141 TaxID=2716417 RepID=A0AAW9Q8N0_9CYAN|nr:efflux RND transporter periplasmic adaptor subunit [Tumidithrix elongata RA019]
MQIPLLGKKEPDRNPIESAQAEPDQKQPKQTEPKKGLRPWLIGLTLVGVLGVGFTAFRMLNRGDTTADITNATETVISTELSIKIKASGSVVPIQSVNVSPKQAGKLTVLLVEQGDRVRKGQIIARMDDSNIEPLVQQARANVASAEATLAKLRNGSRSEEVASIRARMESARASANLANVRVNRYRDLQAQGAITQDRFDEVVTSERTALANLQDLQRQLELAQNGSRVEDIAQAEAALEGQIASLRNLEVQQQDTVIVAPFDGIITQKFSNVGAFVTPTTAASASNSATSTSIVTLANGLEILAKVPEVDIAQIKVGQQVEITADAFPDRVYKGRVRLISPEAVIEQNVTSFQVRILLETGEDQLRSGMNTDLRFIGQKIDNALVVPTVAIVTEDGKIGVLIPDENKKAKFQPVTIGTTVENQTQILKGVKAGDRVFIKLPDNAKPKPK